MLSGGCRSDHFSARRGGELQRRGTCPFVGRERGGVEAVPWRLTGCAICAVLARAYCVILRVVAVGHARH
jgi:hypothetical protein